MVGLQLERLDHTFLEETLKIKSSKTWGKQAMISLHGMAEEGLQLIVKSLIFYVLFKIKCSPVY